MAGDRRIVHGPQAYHHERMPMSLTMGGEDGLFGDASPQGLAGILGRALGAVCSRCAGTAAASAGSKLVDIFGFDGAGLDRSPNAPGRTAKGPPLHPDRPAKTRRAPSSARPVSAEASCCGPSTTYVPMHCACVHARAIARARMRLCICTHTRGACDSAGRPPAERGTSCPSRGCSRAP